MATRIIGDLTVAQQQTARDNLQLLVDRHLRRGRKLTAGTLVGSARTKQFPENPITGQTTRVMFVVDVKLREFEGQPIAVDCYVANQAMQLVTGADAPGTPVTVEVSATGTCTVVGRAAYANNQQSQEFFTVNDVNGVDLSFAYGLRVKNVDDLDADLLARVNDWRTTNGKLALAGGAIYLEDPSISFHGQEYYPAYISPADGGRFLSALAGLTCVTETTKIDPFNGMTVDEADDWWDDATTPAEFAGQDPWDSEIRRTVCS